MVLTFVISPIKCIKVHIFGFFARRKIESGWQFNWNYWLQFHCCHRFPPACAFAPHPTFSAQLGVIKCIYKRIMVYAFFLATHSHFYCFSFCIFWNLSICSHLPHETGCELFEITIHSGGYNKNRIRNDLKSLFTQIGVHNQRTVVLFSMIGDQVSWIVQRNACSKFEIYCLRLMDYHEKASKLTNRKLIITHKTPIIDKILMKFSS